MNQPDTNPDAVKLLSDDEVAEIAVMFPHAEYQPTLNADQVDPCEFCKGTIDDHKANCVVPHVHALCSTVRALRESLRAAVASIKVNDQDEPLDRACPWTLNWYLAASAMLDGQSFDPQPQYEKGFEAGTAFAKSTMQDLQSQLAQVTQEPLLNSQAAISSRSVGEVAADIVREWSEHDMNEHYGSDYLQDEFGAGHLEERIALALTNAATSMRSHCIETVKEYQQRIQGEDDEGMRELLFGALVVKLENMTLEGEWEKR